MTTITIAQLVCDNPHDAEIPAVTTRRITIDGKAYSIDVCGKCNDAIGSLIDGLLENARPVAIAKTPKRKAAGPKPRTEAMRAEDVAIRAWWKVNPDASSRPYQTRGRLPGDVVANYHARKAAA